MRPPRDLLLAVSSPGGHGQAPADGFDLEPVGAVDPWSAPSSAAFPAPLSDLERLRLTQSRRPWALVWKVLAAWTLLWVVGWFVFHASSPTQSQRRLDRVVHVGG